MSSVTLFVPCTVAERLLEMSIKEEWKPEYADKTSEAFQEMSAVLRKEVSIWQ